MYAQRPSAVSGNGGGSLGKFISLFSICEISTFVEILPDVFMNGG